MTYLTESEITALQASSLHTLSPFAICGVSTSYFSVARHYGGMKYNGYQYTYIVTTDELIRDDVMRFVAKLRKHAVKEAVQ